MLTFLNKYGSNTHSQNNEDGLIAEVLRRLDIQTGHCVEVGGNDGLWLSNTRLLLEQGWSGLFLEADFGLYLQCRENWKHNARVRSQCSVVDAQNINAFVDSSCDVLSIDTDGPDYEIFKGLEAKPKIVIVEVDSSIPPDQRGFNQDGGAGYLEMLLLAHQKDYFLLCHTGNMVFLRLEFWPLFPELAGTSALSDMDLYFNRAWIKEAA